MPKEKIEQHEAKFGPFICGPDDDSEDPPAPILNAADQERKGLQDSLDIAHERIDRLTRRVNDLVNMHAELANQHTLLIAKNNLKK